MTSHRDSSLYIILQSYLWSDSGGASTSTLLQSPKGMDDSRLDIQGALAKDSVPHCVPLVPVTMCTHHYVPSDVVSFGQHVDRPRWVRHRDWRSPSGECPPVLHCLTQDVEVQCSLRTCFFQDPWICCRTQNLSFHVVLHLILVKSPWNCPGECKCDLDLLCEIMVLFSSSLLGPGVGLQHLDWR